MSLSVFTLGAVGLVLIGLLGLVRTGHRLQQLLAVNVMGAGVFMLFLVFAAQHAPVDPVAHALVLTGIVVAISTLALGLALIRRLVLEGEHDAELDD